MTLIAYAVPILETAKDVVRKMSKRTVSEHLSKVNILKVHKHCCILQ